MKSLALGLHALGCAYALGLSSRSLTPGTISLPIHRSPSDPQSALEQDRARRLKRQSQRAVDVSLHNTLIGYTANITIGNPPQELSVKLDTGSSDLVVNVPSSSLCRPGSCTGGTYDEDRSSAQSLLASNFSITYVDGRNASGDWVSDTLGFAGVSPFPYIFGTGQESTLDQNVLGIGYESNSVWADNTARPNNSHTSLTQALIDFGLIQASAYSLWLSDEDSETGEILFGGVDQAKYSGNLSTLPIVKSKDGTFKEFVVELSDLLSNGTTLSTGLPADVLLDSGSQLTYLPDKLTETIYNQIHAVSVPSVDNNIYADCGLRNSGATLEFVFGTKSISVPVGSLLIDPAQAFQLEQGVQACIFGISKASEAGGRSILGNTFLRSAYVVFNLVKNEISLAQTTNSASSNIQTIASDGSVPGAQPVSSAAGLTILRCRRLPSLLVAIVLLLGSIP